jgi:hypothetical protein
MAARTAPAVRDQLIAAAGHLRISAAGSAPAAPPAAARLAARAAGAVLKWGMAGLEHAEPWVIEARLAACAACPHLAPAPDTLVYRGVKVVAGQDATICSVCHCLTNTKAAMATEHCPEQDPANPALSRWGEPWTDPATLPGWPWR